jgi:hypothetical protein
MADLMFIPPIQIFASPKKGLVKTRPGTVVFGQSHEKLKYLGRNGSKNSS